MISKTCEFCGAPFLARRATAKYCGQTCNQAAYRLRHGKSTAGSIKTCPLCFRQFKAAHSQQKFCTPSHRSQYSKLKTSGARRVASMLGWSATQTREYLEDYGYYSLYDLLEGIGLHFSAAAKCWELESLSLWQEYREESANG